MNKTQHTNKMSKTNNKQWKKCSTCGGMYKDITDTEIGQGLKNVIEKEPMTKRTSKNHPLLCEEDHKIYQDIKDEFLSKFTVWNDKHKFATLEGKEEYPTPEMIADWWISKIGIAVAKERNRICKLVKTIGATGTEEEVDKMIKIITKNK